MVAIGSLALALVVVLLFLTLIIVIIAAHWKLYTKAGKPGWATLVPIYNQIVLLQIIRKPEWWVIFLFIPLVNIVFMIIMLHNLAKVFGKDVGFTVGLILLPVIFLPILAFGDSKYDLESTRNEPLQLEQAQVDYTFLRVICILSFVGALVNIVLLGIGYASTISISAQMQGSGLYGLQDGVLQQFKLSLLLSVILTLLGVVGVIFMWKLKKVGYYIYTTSQILILVLPFIILDFVSFEPLTLVSIVLTIAFFVMYGMNLKHMS